MVVLITGANKGIGFATAKLFQDKGYKVIFIVTDSISLKESVYRFILMN